MNTNGGNGIKRTTTHKTILHLIQLQDLMVARAQQEASMPGTRLTQLEASINTLIQELPTDITEHFNRLEKKSMLFIVPMSNGVCSACGMNLPVSMVHEIRAAEKIYQCPACARLMYSPEAAPRTISRKQRRTDPPKLGIERFSAVELMVPQLAATERDDVLAELCHRMEEQGFVDNGAKLQEEALKRETIVSTGVECGLAFPHVRGVEGGGLTMALGLSKKGIKFGGPGRALTRIVFFMVIPTAASAFYLKLLSGLSQVFMKEENRDKLFEAETPEKLWKTLVKLTKPIL